MYINNVAAPGAYATALAAALSSANVSKANAFSALDLGSTVNTWG